MKTILILGKDDKPTNGQIQKAHLVIDASKGYVAKNFMGKQDYIETRTEVLSQMFIDYLNSEVSSGK